MLDIAQLRKHSQLLVGLAFNKIYFDMLSTINMDEDSAKEILLSLVSQNRKNPKYNDHIPNEVIGWRFSSSDQNNPNPSPGTNEQYSKPVCEWTGVTCDPIDGTITGLNLGQGFLIEALLGGTPLTKENDDRLKNVGTGRNLHYPFWEEERKIDRNLISNKSPALITSKIPSILGKLLSLRAINLSSNQLQGEIPKSVAGKHICFILLDLSDICESNK